MKKARAMYIPAGGKKAVWGPVDHNVLPEGYPYKEGEAVNWDGNTEGLATATVEGMTLYKVSDKVLTADDIVGMDVFFSGSAVENGLFPNQVTVDNTMIDERDNYVAVGVRVAGGTMVFVAIASFPAAISENTPAGTYVGRLDEGEVSAYVSKYGTETIHPMAPEFLPAGVGGGVQVVTLTGRYTEQSNGVLEYTSSHTGAEIAEMARKGAVVAEIYESNATETVLQNVVPLSGTMVGLVATFMAPVAMSGKIVLTAWSVSENDTSVTTAQQM